MQRQNRIQNTCKKTKKYQKNAKNVKKKTKNKNTHRKIYYH